MAWHEEVEPDRIVFTGDLTEELRRVQINKYIFYGDNNNYDIQSTKKCAQISRMKLMWFYDNSQNSNYFIGGSS